MIAVISGVITGSSAPGALGRSALCRPFGAWLQKDAGISTIRYGTLGYDGTKGTSWTGDHG